MFGIDSIGVGLAYGLAILSTILCIVYGIINWNKGSEDIKKDDIKWVKDEKEIDEKL